MQLQKFEQGLTDYIFSNFHADEISALVKAYSKDELNARLAIYRNNVYASLLSVMSDLYPAVVKTVGENFFNACAKAYLKENPPRQASLVVLAHDFPEFLESFAPATSLPYLPDVARIDLACHQAYHAVDAVPLSAEDFARMSPGELSNSQLQPHPSARLIKSAHACFSIWNLSADTESEINADEAESVLVVRPETAVNTYSLTIGSYHFISSLFTGNTLEQALSEGIDNDASFHPAEAIQFLIQSGLATKIVGDPSA